jgi:hypothetical protein
VSLPRQFSFFIDTVEKNEAIFKLIMEFKKARDKGNTSETNKVLNLL